MIRNAKLQTNLGHANDWMSRLATRLLQAERQLEFSYEEMHAYGAPSECGNLISDSFTNELHSIYVEAGVTEFEFFRQMEERTSPRWVYFNSGIVRRGSYEEEGGW